MTTFQDVKMRIGQLETIYKAIGYTTVLQTAENAYRLEINNGNRNVIIRDGYFSDTNINPRPVELTSFEVFFTVDSLRFGHYISDYPLEEYPLRLSELKLLIDHFFAGKFTISIDSYMIFWRKNYLNIKNGDDTYHFQEVKRQ